MGYTNQTLCTSAINLSEKLEIDLSEIMNALNDEQTNILSALDPTTQIEGAALFYKGYLIENQLEKVYLEAVLRVALLYNLLEHNTSQAERGVVEVVQVNNTLAPKIDLLHTIMDDNAFFENRIKECKLPKLINLGMKESKEGIVEGEGQGKIFINS